MRPPARSSWPELGAVVGAVLLGAWLRLNALEYAQFRPDDESLWALANQLIEQPRVLTRGIPSSFGLSNGPFQVYLLAPGAALSNGPIGAYVWVAMLNVGGLLLFWRFVRSHWGPQVAAIALVLAATNPWAVMFSRRLLGNDLVAPFTVLLIASLCAWIARGRGRELVLAFLWLTVVVQLYVVALLHFGLIAVGLVVGRRHLRWRPLMIGGAVLSAGVLPYATRAVVRELDAPARLVGQPDRAAVVDLDSVRLMLHFVSTEGYQAFATQTGGVVDATTGWPLLVSLAVMAAMAAGMGIAAVEAARLAREGRWVAAAPRLLALIAVALPALLLLRHVTPVHPGYLVTGLPMQYLFAAIGIWRVGRLAQQASPAVGRVALAGMLAAVVGTYVMLAQVFFGGVREYWSKSDYGLPLRHTLDLAALSLRAAKEAGTDRLLVVGGEEHAGVLHRLIDREMPAASVFDPTESLIVPSASAATALYVLADPADTISATIAAAPGSRRVETVVVPGEGLRYELVAATPARVRELVDREVTGNVAAEIDGRIALDGFVASELLTPGQPERLAIAWSVPERPIGDRSELTGFLRLVGTDDRSLGGPDFKLISPSHWHPGDRIVSWVSVPVPAALEPGAYAYRVGLYSVDAAGGYRILPVKDPRGAAAGETVRLPWRLVPPPPSPEPSTRVDRGIGGAVRLLGYDLSVSGCGGPRRVELALHWAAERRLEQDYTVFVHLVGPDGKMVAQHDAQPAGGRFPTSAWLPGERTVDARTIEIPAGAPAGTGLLVGMYSLPSGERLGGADAAVTLPTGPVDCPRA
jgi:hypothetical protein